MILNYDPCESRLLAHEGSRYTDGVNPYDPGGPTRWGITLADARLYWKASATADDVKTMDISVAKAIYKKRYWDRIGGDSLLGGVDDTVFDYAVNSGFGRAGKVLRRVMSLPDHDWQVTPDVITALSKRDPISVINAVNDERLNFMRSLAIWPTYKNGWTRRVADVRGYSIQLSKNGPVAPPVIREATGKAQVNPPTKAKDATKTAGGVATAAGGGFAAWLGAHPVLIGGVVVVGVAAIGGAIYLLDENHRKKQEAPSQGLAVVPELKAA